MASKLWDYLNVVTHTKRVEALDEPEFEKDYQPYLINRALSYHEDAVLAANLMNERSSLDRRAQALFLLNTLRPRKRFAKWIKSETSDDERSVAEYYGCGLRHARELVALHSSDQLTTIRRRLDKGGVTATKRTRNGST